MLSPRFFLGVVLLFLVLAAPAFAQPTEPTVSIVVGYFAAGIDPNLGGSPIQAPNTYPVTSVVCNLAKVSAPGIVTNPTTIRWDDPADVTKDCRLMLGSTALGSAPTGTGYRAFIRAQGATQISDWSEGSNPFGVAPLPPVTLRNVRVQ